MIIHITIENRSSSSAGGYVKDFLWDKWKKLDNASFIENNDSFILESVDGEEYIALKNNELFAAKMYNLYLSADLVNFDVFEGKNPSGGYFLLYKFKNEINKFYFITGITGFATCSSIGFDVN